MHVPTPVPANAEVLIRVWACGVCKTDVHIDQGHFFAAFPLIPGHEFAGEVVAVGNAVTRVRVGERVVADNQRQCGVCDCCRRGEPLFCVNVYAQGVNAPGGFAEYTLVHESQVYPLAEDISMLEGALVEPTACAVHGMDVIEPHTGDAVLQFGAGPTGLILAQLLHHRGAAPLVVADLSPVKLGLAVRWADAEPVSVVVADSAVHTRALHERYPQGFNIVIDATGVSHVAESLPQFARNGAKIVYYGVCPEDDRIQISPYDVFRRELKIIGSFSQVHTFDRAVRLINSGIVRVQELITHTFPLEGWRDALQMVTTGSEHVKVVITPQSS